MDTYAEALLALARWKVGGIVALPAADILGAFLL